MRQYPLEILPEFAAFKDVLALYAEKRGDRLMPRWQDFDFPDFLGWHSRIALSKREGSDFRFRIFGSTFTDLFNRDLTGELLIASMPPHQQFTVTRSFPEDTGSPLIRPCSRYCSNERPPIFTV